MLKCNCINVHLLTRQPGLEICCLSKVRTRPAGRIGDFGNFLIHMTRKIVKNCRIIVLNRAKKIFVRGLYHKKKKKTAPHSTVYLRRDVIIIIIVGRLQNRRLRASSSHKDPVPIQTACPGESCCLCLPKGVECI